MLETAPTSVLPAAPVAASTPSATSLPVALVAPAGPATSTAPRRDRTRTAAVVATACVAVAVALYLGREFFAPLAVAIVLSVLLRPVVRAWGGCASPPRLRRRS